MKHRGVTKFLVSFASLMALWMVARWLWPEIDAVIIGSLIGLAAITFAVEKTAPPSPLEAPAFEVPPISELVEYLRFTSPGLTPAHLRQVAEGAHELIKVWAESGIPVDHPSMVSLLTLEEECSQRAITEQTFRDNYVPSPELLAYMQGEPDVN